MFLLLQVTLRYISLWAAPPNVEHPEWLIRNFVSGLTHPLAMLGQGINCDKLYAFMQPAQFSAGSPLLVELANLHLAPAIASNRCTAPVAWSCGDNTSQRCACMHIVIISRAGRT
jgi:hypothetical protein